LYEEFVAEFYDYLPVTVDRKDVEFYAQAARAQGEPILELGCGTGRVLLPIARAGARVVGLDLSEAMLAQARAKLQAEPKELQERTRLAHGDMTDFDLRATFRLVIIPFRPFQHLVTVDAQMACLRCVHAHLVNGGRLVMDFFHTDPRRISDPVFLEERSTFADVTLPDGRKLRTTDRVVRFRRAEQTNDVEMIFHVEHPDGRTERLVHAFAVRYFFRYEVEHLLGRCGFRLLDVYGNFEGVPFADDSTDMVFVAEKI
jgi:SAM-dependent methyltransferase